MKNTERSSSQKYLRKAGLLASLIAAIFAQTAFSADVEDTEVLEEVVVTGIRSSMSDAIDVKRNSSQILDSIVAEDIGKLPDSNVAEALQRISGVQIRRGVGEGSSVAIRGLRQNRIEINGRALLSPGGRGSVIDDAFGKLFVIPSEMVGRLDVTKLLSADMIEGSLGGTVNIVSRKAIDNPGFHLSTQVQSLYLDQRDSYGYSVSGMVSNTNDDETFGASIGVVYSEREIREDKVFSFSGWRPIEGFDSNGDGLPSFRMSDIRFQQREDDRERLAVMANLQYEPSQDLSFYADGSYAHLEQDRHREWFAVPLSGDPAAYTNPQFSAADSLIAATINTGLQSNAVAHTLPTTLYSGGVGGEYIVDRWTFATDVSFSKSETDFRQAFTRFQSINTYDVGFSFTPNALPTISLPSDFDATDISLFNANIVWDDGKFYDAEEVAARFDVEFDLDGSGENTLQFGVRYSEIEQVTSFDRARVNGGSADLHPELAEVVDYSDLFDGANLGTPSAWITPRMFGLTNSIPDFTTELNCSRFVPDCARVRQPLASSDTAEDIGAFYAKLNFSKEIGDIPYSGNIGLRVVRTDLTASGSQNNEGVISPVNFDVSYADVLPSAIISFDLTEKVKVRFGAAKVMARPDTTLLNPGVTLFPKDLIGSSGSPFLDPFRADQFDFSFEYYFAESSALVVGLFYKDVESFIGTETVSTPISGFDDPFLITRSFNGEGGTISGLEFSYQQAFTNLSAPFDAMGLSFNYSYIDSTTPIINSRNGEALPIEGLSDQNANLILFYETDAVGIRVAYNARSEFLDRISAGGGGVFQSSFDSLDFSAEYHFADRYTISFQAVNLLDEESIKFNTSPEAIRSYEDNDRTFTLSFRANLF